jgi:citrate lyase subunit beta/citryl-CoA lyase
MRLRSLLFAPGDSTRKAEKALGGDADVVILDLEDSVAATAKEHARDTVAGILRTRTRPGVAVRVNAIGTPWYLADLASVVAARPDFIMLPKATGTEALLALDHHLSALETAFGLALGAIRVLPIATEEAQGVLALDSLQAAPRLAALCFGAEDLSADLGIDPRRADGSYPAPISASRALLLLVAARLGIPAIDTPFPDPRDPAGLEHETRTASVDGFAGKLCIHPDQVAPVNAIFTPSPARIAWARAVLDGFAANPGAGVFTLDGKMIDRPHLRLAERILTSLP